MIRLEDAPEGQEVETIDLFAIGDSVYTVPKKPRANVALKYLRDVRKLGEAVAASALLEAMLGTEGFDALCDFEDLTTEQLNQVIETAARLAMGSLEDGDQGNGSSGSGKSAG